MSGLLAFVPVIFEAVTSTVAAVSTAATSIGAAVFGGAAAGGGLLGTLGSIASGALSSAVTGAAIGGAASLITGGDFLDGVKNGALGGAITGGVGGVIDAVGGATSSALVQAKELPGVGLPQATELTLPEFDVAGGATASGGTGFGGFGSGTGAGDIARMGASATAQGGNGAATGGAAGAVPASTSGGGNGIFDGFLNKESVGGMISGVGKVLSGDTAQAAAEANNQGAMDRQTQQQQYIAGNYGSSGGFSGFAGGNLSNPNGRPTPTQQFAPSTQDMPGAKWEYFFDPTTNSLGRKPVGT